MRGVGGRTQVAVLSGALVFWAGAAGAMAQGSKAADDRGRQGAEVLREQALEARETATATATPVAAEVKAHVVTGTVVQIDREARQVILRDTDTGEEIDLLIPADATNFDELKVGDRMDLNVLQPLELARPR